MSSTIWFSWAGEALMAALAVGLLLLAYELLRGYRLHRPFRLGLLADVKPKKHRRESGNHREGDDEA